MILGHLYVHSAAIFNFVHKVHQGAVEAGRQVVLVEVQFRRGHGGLVQLASPSAGPRRPGRLQHRRTNGAVNFAAAWL